VFRSTRCGPTASALFGVAIELRASAGFYAVRVSPRPFMLRCGISASESSMALAHRPESRIKQGETGRSVVAAQVSFSVFFRRRTCSSLQTQLYLEGGALL
jgi:hypothetical protein